MRLVGFLLGLVFTVLSLLDRFNGLGSRSVTLPVELTFLFGIVFFLLTMAGVIVTYLSSQFRIGLHQNVGHYLSHPETEIEDETHAKRVVGAYASMLEQNQYLTKVRY